MTHLQTLFEQYLGKDVILYTTDGYSDRMINCGSLPTLFTTVDFGAGKESKAELDGVLCSRRGIEWSPVHQTCKILSAHHMIHVCVKKKLDYFFLVAQEQTLGTRGNEGLLELSLVYGWYSGTSI